MRSIAKTGIFYFIPKIVNTKISVSTIIFIITCLLILSLAFSFPAYAKPVPDTGQTLKYPDIHDIPLYPLYPLSPLYDFISYFQLLNYTPVYSQLLNFSYRQPYTYAYNLYYNYYTPFTCYSPIYCYTISSPYTTLGFSITPFSGTLGFPGIWSPTMPYVSPQPSNIMDVLCPYLLCPYPSVIKYPSRLPPTQASVKTLAPFQLRLMTYNAGFLSVTVHVPLVPDVVIELSGGDFEDRAEKIAEGILRAAPDVVVLNEVFDERAKNILVDKLGNDYHHYVSVLSAVAEIPIDILADIIGLIAQLLDVVPDAVGSIEVDPLNSGLMIFSKFKFLSLGSDPRNDASCLLPSCDMEGQNGSSSLQNNHVAFSCFSDCGTLDCLASKGVGLVKLETPDLPTYVAFTHMQADEGGTYSTVRKYQYQDIENLLKETIPGDELFSLPVYLLGDLNTPGGKTEWYKRFDPYNYDQDPFFACGNDSPCHLGEDGKVLIDAWGFETSPADEGKTSAGGNRLDYIAHNHADYVLCMQHVRIPFEVGANKGKEWYSDHYPVYGDFNRTAQWCSPNVNARNHTQRPKEIEFGPPDCVDGDPNAQPCHQDEVFGPAEGARITFPGSFQWFIIRLEGSYSIKTSSPHPTSEVGFDVYKYDDLSRKLIPFNDFEHLDWGWTFPMPDPPYYIRTYATTDDKPDRTVGNVDYTISIHQHLCREPIDACPLIPNEPYVSAWPNQTQVVADVKELWYKFETSSVRDGRLMPPDNVKPVYYPDITLLYETSAAQTCMRKLRLVEFADPYYPDLNGIIKEYSFSSKVCGDRDNDGDPDCEYTPPDLDGEIPDYQKEYYYVSALRDCKHGMETSLLYETTLTYLEPGRIECDMQYDDSGIGEDDHIRFDFTFDKPGGGSSSPCENFCDYYDTFDEAWPEDWQQPGYADLGGKSGLHGYYVNHFFPNLFEDEGDEDDPDFRLAIWSVDDTLSSYDMWEKNCMDTIFGVVCVPIGLSPLPPDVLEIKENKGMFTFSDDDDYRYFMEFWANHTGPTKEGASY